MAENEFRMSNFQRTQLSHIEVLYRQIENPIASICKLIENSVQASASSILINLAKIRNFGARSAEESDKFDGLCLHIKDNGVGIPKHLMHQVCTSFGKINHTVTANDFHTAEHGVGLKLNALRIGKTCLILTRSGNNVSVGLLSLQFIADAGLNYIVAPVVSYEV